MARGQAGNWQEPRGTRAQEAQLYLMAKATFPLKQLGWNHPQPSPLPLAQIETVSDRLGIGIESIPG